MNTFQEQRNIIFNFQLLILKVNINIKKDQIFN